MIQKLISQKTFNKLIENENSRYVIGKELSSDAKILGFLFGKEWNEETCTLTGRFAVFQICSIEPCESESGEKVLLRLRLMVTFEEDFLRESIC